MSYCHHFVFSMSVFVYHLFKKKKKKKKKEWYKMACCLFVWKQICVGFVCLFLFGYICIVFWDSIMRVERLDPINQFNPATFLCLFQTRTWMSNAIMVCFFVLKNSTNINKMKKTLHLKSLKKKNQNDHVI